MREELKKKLENLEYNFDQISAPRKEQLRELSSYIQKKYEAEETPQINVICTHNSRRSHLAQLWLLAGASYYQLPPILAFSGGTEATAFHPNAVAAMQKQGFLISLITAGDNPVYEVKWEEKEEGCLSFSKKIETPPNPTKNFMAVMVCSEADKSCPSVTGADSRLALPFDDPKNFDGTAQEGEKYEERALQIGTEMLYALSLVKRS